MHGQTLKKLTKSSDRLLDDVDVVIMSVLLRASSYEPAYRDALRLGFI